MRPQKKAERLRAHVGARHRPVREVPARVYGAIGPGKFRALVGASSDGGCCGPVGFASECASPLVLRPLSATRYITTTRIARF